ncbi:hypothetical protein B296_00025700 [Ensete ventricosum]|uniref:Uncharacterized protein n=1 Tax=Ensete ventricosum TaxID=4639 RepID=A0A426ZT32_ENSVE|nr:hypothetical protein B296_00025700 [Ensete ventricosum]
MASAAGHHGSPGNPKTLRASRSDVEKGRKRHDPAKHKHTERHCGDDTFTDDSPEQGDLGRGCKRVQSAQMWAKSQVSVLGRGSKDVVQNHRETRRKHAKGIGSLPGVHRELVEGIKGLLGVRRMLPKISEACREFIGSSSKGSEACREFAGSSLKGSEAYREFARSLPKVSEGC